MATTAYQFPHVPLAAQPWWVRQALRVRTFQALANPHFRTLWLGLLASYLAMQAGMIARGYLAYDISGSAAILGLVTMSRGLPQLFVSPVAGVIADRVDKRQMLVLTQIGAGVISALTAVLVQLQLIEVWHLIALGVAEGAVFALNMPPRQAIVPELIPDNDLMNAIALNNSGMSLMRIVGPSLAGALIAAGAAGLYLTFYIIAVCYLGFIAALWRLPRERRIQPIDKAPFHTQLFGGFHYMFTYPALAILFGMALIPILLGMSYQPLLPVFAKDVFAGGGAKLGTLSAAAGLGSLVGSLVIASLSNFPYWRQLQVAFGVLFGVSLFAFAVTPLFGLALLWMFLVGMSGNAFTSMNSTMIMQVADRAYHGRVMSVWQVTWAFQPIFLLPLGRIVDAVGPQATMAVCGLIVAVFIAGAGMARLRQQDRTPLPT